LTNPDSAASAERNLEVLRGLSELELLKLLGQLQGQGSVPVFLPLPVRRKRLGAAPLSRHLGFPSPNTIRLDTTPPPGFQPRLITHQESTSGFSPAGDTGSGSISGLPPVYLLREVPDMVEWLLLVALWVHFRFLLYSFLRVRKPDVTPRFHFRFVDPIPDMESLLPPL
jgi:hypothetical protein